MTRVRETSIRPRLTAFLLRPVKESPDAETSVKVGLTLGWAMAEFLNK